MAASVKGYCSICGEFGELSQDHVPPKGSANLSRVAITTLADHMGTSRSGRPVLSESGVRFKTLCSYCNSTRLGRWYDPELKRISSGVTRVLSASAFLSLPETVTISAKPQRVARAVVGHLLAAVPAELTTQPPSDAAMPRALREYFLNPCAPLPDAVSIYYWTYPSRRVVIARGITKTNIRFSPLIIGDILKFYPLGYWLVWDPPPAQRGPLSPLLVNRAEGIDSEVDLPIRFRHQPPLDFPEAPGPDEATFMHDRAGVTAAARLTRQQSRRRRG